MTFHYRREGERFDVGIKPLKIANFDGYWYVIGLESRTNVCKKYHLKSMSTIQSLEKTFTRSKALDDKLDNAINIWFRPDNATFEVVLHVDAMVAKYFMRKPLSKSQRTVAAHEDGSMLLSFKITHEMEILPTIMEFVPHVRVHSPDFLDEAVRERLRAYLCAKSG